MPEIDTNLLTNKLPALLTRMPEAIRSANEFRGDLTLQIDPNRIKEVIQFLKEESSLKFNVMMDLFATDYLTYEPKHPDRFAVTYILYSMMNHSYVTLKAYISEDCCEIDSIHEIYAAANWFEREAWDLYGIVFKGHPNLIRILCHNDFVGHPLRKDYPSDQYQRLKASATSSGF